MIWLGLSLALGSAVLINLGLFIEHRAAADVPVLRLRHPLAGMLLLLKNPAWLLGYGSGWVGWFMYIGALVFAPLSLVQGVAAAGIGVLALLVQIVAGVRLTRGEWIAVAASMLGLVLIATTVGITPHPHHHMHARRPEIIFLAIAVLVIFGSLVFGVAAKLANWGAALGAVSGVAFAAGDVATKAAITHRGWIFVALLIVLNVSGFAALQLSFQRGGALATAGVSSLLNNALPIGAGIVVFGERLPTGPPGIMRVLAFVAALAGATYLASRPPVAPVRPPAAESR
ncbi:MAG: DMT family protein [Acidimicrobiales bacterium]